jgi:demethoxyubiquinone hydroxylase (CLK1/Coq7/Cat5 family)
MIVCLLTSLTITINKQTVISHHYHQQTNNPLSPLSSTIKQTSHIITINKQTIISHHYHQQTNKRDDCLFVDVNGER